MCILTCLAFFIINIVVYKKNRIFISNFTKIYRRLQEFSFVFIMVLLGVFYHDYEYRTIKNLDFKEVLVIIVIVLIILNIIIEVALIIKNAITAIIEIVRTILRKREEAAKEKEKNTR
jgi:hypothetical protein